MSSLKKTPLGISARTRGAVPPRWNPQSLFPCWEAALSLLTGMFSDMFKFSRAKGDRLLHSLFQTCRGQPVSPAADKTASLSTLQSAEVLSLLQNLPAVRWSDSGSFFVISTAFSFRQFAGAALILPVHIKRHWGTSYQPKTSSLLLIAWVISGGEHDSQQLRSSELSPQSSSPSHLHLSGTQRWLSQRKSPFGSQVTSSARGAGTWNFKN